MENCRTLPCCLLGGAVRGAVVDHENVIEETSRHFTENTSNGVFFV